MNNTYIIAKNTFYLYLRSLLVLLINLYTSRVVLKTLGVEDYGVFCVVGGVISLLGLLTNTMQQTYQRFFNVEMGRNNAEGVKKIFQLSLSTQIILAFLIIIIGETIGLWFVTNKLVIPENRLIAAQWVYQASILTFIIRIFTTPFGGAIIAYERMGFFAVISILDVVLKLCIVFLIKVLPGDHLVTYSFLLAFISLVNIIIYLIYCKKNIPTVVVGFRWDRHDLKSIFVFSWWSLFGEMGNTIKTQGINIILNIFFGPVVNAARGISAQILGAVKQFIQSFQTSFRPQLTKSYASGNYQYMQRLYYSASKMSYYLVFTLSLPIILETPYILHLWLGDNVPEYTAIFTRIVLVTAFISAFANPTSCIAYATGKIKWFSIIVGVGNIMILPISWFFLKKGYGPVSALFVSFVMMVIIQIARLLVTVKTASLNLMDYFIKVLIPTLLFSIITPWLPYFVKNNFSFGFFRLVGVCLVSVVVCLSVGWFIGLDRHEKKFILKQIYSRRVKY